MKRVLTAFALISILSLSVTAQKEENKRPWTDKIAEFVQGSPWVFDSVLHTSHSKYLVNIGQIGILDEYLSPIRHTGYSLSLNILTDRQLSETTDRWHYYQEVMLNAGIPKNPANSTTMYVMAASYSGAPVYRLLNHHHWIADIGPMGVVGIQSQAKPSNSNNVINFKGGIGIDAWGRIMYRIPWKVMPVNISYSAQIPIFHMSYYPQYGQSYYDYVSGENKVSPKFYPVSFHNGLGLRHRLLIDLPIRNITFTIGVEHEHIKERINNTNYRRGALSFVMGISVDHIFISGNRSTRSKQILSPLISH